MANPPPDQFSSVLASVFKETREKAGLSQKRLSEISGVGRTGIVTMEAGDRIPSILICKMLADGMKVPLANIVAEVERRLNSSRC
ncbi:helix-turn-helix domain-containing protein [Prosthecobacter fusiformis]|uniref:helix-turn-helix transcriptional regulator n=1 Tax=Prosthecobacter fusiformis TaxID=48464 RepID=UPI001414D666